MLTNTEYWVESSNKKLTHKDYEHIVWRLTQTLDRLGYSVYGWNRLPVVNNYAYKYGVLGGKFK